MIALLLACTGGSSDPSIDGSGPPTDDPGLTDPTGPTGTTGSAGGPTWWADLRPVVATRCATCHAPGDIGPFPLTTYEEARPWAEAMAMATASGSMPPWPPSSDCAPLEGDRTLPQAEVDLFAAWAAAGAPEGDPADATTVPEEPPFVGDLELAMVEPYTPLASADDYRCFVVDWPEAEPTFVTAYQVEPGARDLVHHVILYVADRADAETADADEPGPGYTCFASAGIPATTLGSWVPGVSGVRLPEGTGIQVDPGSAVIVQVHYNTLSTEPRPDTTRLSVVVEDQVDAPAASVLYTDPLWLLGGMQIPAGDADVVHSTTVSSATLGFMATGIGGSFGDPLRLHRVGLHMHMLGTETTLRLKRSDGSEQCLLDIPQWDFHWQGGYNLVDPITIEGGDQIELGCRWDNSGPGAQDVAWGEGTGDEMCLAGLYLTR